MFWRRVRSLRTARRTSSRRTRRCRNATSAPAAARRPCRGGNAGRPRARRWGPVPEPRLQLSGLRAGYDRVAVVFDVDLEVEPGEIVILVGGNGAGKSTLLQAVMGTVAVLAGEIRYDGRPISRWPVARR